MQEWLKELLGEAYTPQLEESLTAALALSGLYPRVIGSDHSLTGYGGGLAAKKLLLDLETTHHNLSDE